MKKVIVLVSMIVLGFTSIGFAIDQTSPFLNTMVVDKTTKNAALNNYVLSTRDRIQKVWTTPLNIQTSDALKGKVAVMYEVARDGSLSSLQLVRSSGNPDMDRSLLNAIRNAAPFPAFPQELRANRLLIKANFIVADLPVVPVLKVEHRITSQDNSKSQQVEPQKKYIWGIPAGTALRKDLSIPQDESLQEKSKAAVPFPHSMKFEWGLKDSK
ncbi:MAG: TonB family protein [Desulfomonilaceae bacterium]